MYSSPNVCIYLCKYSTPLNIMCILVFKTTICQKKDVYYNCVNMYIWPFYCYCIEEILCFITIKTWNIFSFFFFCVLHCLLEVYMKMIYSLLFLYGIRKFSESDPLESWIYFKVRLDIHCMFKNEERTKKDPTAVHRFNLKAIV